MGYFYLESSMKFNELVRPMQLGLLYADAVISLMEITKEVVKVPDEPFNYGDLTLLKTWSHKPIVMHGSHISYEVRIQANRVHFIGDEILSAELYPMSSDCTYYSNRNRDYHSPLISLYDLDSEDKYNEIIQYYSDSELFIVGAWNRIRESYLYKSGEGIVIDILGTQKLFGLPSQEGFVLPAPFKRRD